MPLVLEIDGAPGEVFSRIVRALPDGHHWLVSDPDGRVVIARIEGEELFRELILSPRDDGRFDVEALASRGVSEFAVMALVALAITASLVAITWLWFNGPSGRMGFALGMVMALGVPSGVIALGQRFVDPGREPLAERNLERAVRHATATLSDARWINTDD